MCSSFFGLVFGKKTKKLIKKGSTGNLTLYAKWSVNKYTVRFNGNGATSGKMADAKNLIYDKTYSLRTNTFKRTGYEFIGWNTKADGSGTSIADKGKIRKMTYVNGAVKTVYAQWLANTFYVSFNDNGADAGTSIDTMQCTYDNSCVAPYGTFDKAGYVFGGWNTAMDGSGKTYSEGGSIKNLTSVNGKNVTLYSYWRVAVPTFSLTNVKYDNVKVTVDAVENAEGYVIYRSTKSSSGFKAVGTLTAAGSYSDTKLSASKTYYYKVRAYYTNEYGVKIYSKYSDVTKWKTAAKPKVAGQLTNSLGYYSTRGYVYLENRGSKPLYIQNLALVYPYKNANYSSATVPSYSTLSYMSLSAGSATTLAFRMDDSRYFTDGAHITFTVKYDDCSYFFMIYEDGTGVFV